MIPLMRNTFINEHQTRKELADFILQADRLSMGEQCREFERKFSNRQGSRHAILFNSGGSANLALLQALKNLGALLQGDLVGFSGLTWSTNVMPIIQMGFTPVPVDCDPRYLNVTSETLQEAIEELGPNRMKALFITNALGFAGDLSRIRDICSDNGILLLEDNCESLGTQLEDGPTGSFGVAATFSFFVAHHMSTVEGGMICTNDDDLNEMLRITRANGWDRDLSAAQQAKWRKRFDVTSELQAKYTFYDLGFNLRPTEITGFIGQQQLQYLDENINKRLLNYLKFETAIHQNDDLIAVSRSNLKLASPFALPVICKTPELREKYLAQFAGGGIEVRPIIAGDMQQQPFFKKYVSREYDLPGTRFVHECGFYSGNFPEMSERDTDTVVSCLTKR